MISECRKVSLPEPIYKTDSDIIRLIFRYAPINRPGTDQIFVLVKTLDDKEYSTKISSPCHLDRRSCGPEWRDLLIC